MEEQGFKTHHALARDSIRAFCIQCMGYQPSEVPKCTAGKFCPLYPWRMGKTPKTERLGRTEAIEMSKRSHPAFSVPSG
jgi:hypothetical protein